MVSVLKKMQNVLNIYALGALGMMTFVLVYVVIKMKFGHLNMDVIIPRIMKVENLQMVLTQMQILITLIMIPQSILTHHSMILKKILTLIIILTV